DFSDSIERFNTFQEATDTAKDMRKQAIGEVLLAFVNPILMKTAESSIKSVVARRAKALAQRAEQATEEATEGAEEGATEAATGAGEAAATATAGAGEAAAAAATEATATATATGEAVGLAVGDTAVEEGLLAGITIGAPEIAAPLLIASMVATSVFGFRDIFDQPHVKKPKPPPKPLANVPQLGI
ncbi:MAG: hypothetical protein CMB97_00325, partial [Flavobacteriaceae bacterium]|nr:hypothetical protein [Flavobacteriaceae bacterium]